MSGKTAAAYSRVTEKAEPNSAELIDLLFGLMRKHGVRKLRVGDIEVKMSPHEPPNSKPMSVEDKPTEKSPTMEELLLWSVGGVSEKKPLWSDK